MFNCLQLENETFTIKWKKNYYKKIEVTVND